MDSFIEYRFRSFPISSVKLANGEHSTQAGESFSPENITLVSCNSFFNGKTQVFNEHTVCEFFAKHLPDASKRTLLIKCAYFLIECLEDVLEEKDSITVGERTFILTTLAWNRAAVATLDLAQVITRSDATIFLEDAAAVLKMKGKGNASPQEQMANSLAGCDGIKELQQIVDAKTIVKETLPKMTAWCDTMNEAKGLQVVSQLQVAKALHRSQH